jgi:hypothetical protein
LNDGEDGEEDLFADGKISPFFPDDQAYSGGVGLTLQDAGTPWSGPARAVVSPQYLFLASFTSRPPPAL